MRVYQDKANVAAAPDSIITTKFGGGEATSVLKELKNAASPTGQTLSSADGTIPAEKFNQLAQALFINATGAQTFQDGGAADAYVVTPVTGASGLVVPDDYDNMNGAIISFIPDFVNTGASTLNLGQTAGTLLGTKKILSLAGAALAASVLDTTNYHDFRYDTAADGAVGAWIFIGKQETITSGYLYNAYGKWSETQTSGTDGGNFASGSWQTRDLNTEDSDTDSLGALAASQLTLEAGTYVCAGSAVAHFVQEHAIQLYDTTGAAVLVNGTSDQATLSGQSTRSFIGDKFTIAVQSVLELQHYCIVTRNIDGFGVPTTIGGRAEVYATLELWRVA